MYSHSDEINDFSELKPAAKYSIFNFVITQFLHFQRPFFLIKNVVDN